MNILLSIVQVLLALHTAAGAVWKFSSSAAQTMPSLGVIPQEVWLAMSVLELFCALALIASIVNKRFAMLAPVAAAAIIVEMLLFSGLHIASGSTDFGPVIYWLTVAVVCALLIAGRLIRKKAV